MRTEIETGKKKTGRPESPDSIRAQCLRLSRCLGFMVTPQAFAWWQKKNYPLDDLNALRWKLLNQSRMPEGCDPERLRRDMQRSPLFGRHVRNVLEDMPLRLIDELELATDRRGRFAVLAAWVGYALEAVCTHDDIAEGILLTPEEVEDMREYNAERARAKEEAGEV